MKRRKSSGYAVCIKNTRFAAALELRKIYRVRADARASQRGLLRVVDESGEDYLYPSTYFAPIEVSPALRRALAAAGQ
jgi:hypothetical protein